MIPAEWVQDAESRVKLLEGKYRLDPDQVVFQPWVLRPTHSLPEDDPSTLTSLIDWYCFRGAEVTPQNDREG
jgi:hypothetical protein